MRGLDLPLPGYFKDNKDREVVSLTSSTIRRWVYVLEVRVLTSVLFCKKRKDSWLFIRTTTFTSTRVAAPKARAAKIIPVPIFLKGLLTERVSNSQHFYTRFVIVSQVCCLLFWHLGFITLCIARVISTSSLICLIRDITICCCVLYDLSYGLNKKISNYRQRALCYLCVEPTDTTCAP